MRQPLLVISPYAKQNFVDHSTTDQSSVVRFIDDSGPHGERIGNGAADAIAGTLINMFALSNSDAGNHHTENNFPTVRAGAGRGSRPGSRHG